MPYNIPKTKYLGIKFDPNKPFSLDYNFLFGKIRSKTENWNSKFISQAGWVTLIKSNHQSIPTYVMQTKILEKSECATLDKAYKKILCCGLWSPQW